MREGTRRGEVQARRGLVPASSFSRACFAACSSSTASNILARRSGACGIGASVERAPKKEDASRRENYTVHKGSENPTVPFEPPKTFEPNVKTKGLLDCVYGGHSHANPSPCVFAEMA